MLPRHDAASPGTAVLTLICVNRALYWQSPRGRWAVRSRGQDARANSASEAHLVIAIRSRSISAARYGNDRRGRRLPIHALTSEARQATRRGPRRLCAGNIPLAM